MVRGISRILLRGLAGILFFIIVWVLANFFSQYTTNESVLMVLDTVNANIVLLLVIAILFLIGELLFAFRFPFSLPAPLFNAVGGVLIASFVFNMLYLVDDLAGQTIFRVLEPVTWLVYFLVFVIVLIAGYFHVISDIFTPKRKERIIIVEEEPRKKKKKARKESVTWDEVGEEFKEAMHSFAQALKEAFEPKKKK